MSIKRLEHYPHEAHTHHLAQHMPNECPANIRSEYESIAISRWMWYPFIFHKAATRVSDVDMTLF